MLGDIKYFKHTIITLIKIPLFFIKLHTFLRKFTENHFKLQGNGEKEVRAYMNAVLKSHDFESAQKVANKLFNLTKDDSLLFFSILLQTMDSNKKPNYMILSLFLDKVVKAYGID